MKARQNKKENAFPGMMKLSQNLPIDYAVYDFAACCERGDVLQVAGVATMIIAFDKRKGGEDASLVWFGEMMEVGRNSGASYNGQMRILFFGVDFDSNEPKRLLDILSENEHHKHGLSERARAFARRLCVMQAFREKPE